MLQPRAKRSPGLLPRPILVVHRWLGVFVGLLMTVWCLSGFVMTYVDYPRLDPAAQVTGLAPLHLPAGGGYQAVAIAPDTPLSSARVEMLAGRAVLRIVPAEAADRAIPQMRAMPAAFDLAGGRSLAPPDPQDMRRIARDFASGHGIAGAPAAPVETAIDQWTVQAYKRNAPLYRVDFADRAGTQIYISGRSGEVVQKTSRFQRSGAGWGPCRTGSTRRSCGQNGALWNQVVIWTSLAGCFLTVTGIWAGIARIRRKRDGRVGSPYKGLWWWHHVFGLFFGLLTLTWVASGLFSMNPWGFLDSTAGPAERERLAGAMPWRDVRQALAALPDLPADAVRIETAPLGGRTFLLVTQGSGARLRYDAAGKPSPLAGRELRAALSGPIAAASLDLMGGEDAYYYRHRFPAPLPVWRAVLADAGQTRLYIDPVSGQIVRAVDRGGRGSRWLQDGLHSLDFPVLRKRPWRDFAVLPLLAAVTLVCATGTWMAWNKVHRDLRRIWRRVWRRRARRRGDARHQ